MSTEILDVRLCMGTSDDSPLDACRGLFPHKDHPGLCARCLMLKSSASDKDKIEQIMESVHCRGCGSVGRHFDRQEKLCGGCIVRKDHVEQDPKLRRAQELQDEAARLMAEARPDAYNARSSQTTRPSREAPRTVPAGNRRISAAPAPTSTSSAGHDASGRRIEISLWPCVGSQQFVAMGKMTCSYDADTPMTDVAEEGVQRMNASYWDKKCTMSLERDVDVRWTGNLLPEPGTMGMTVGEFYDTHWVVSHRHIYFNTAPRRQKVRSQNSQHMCLELLIDVAGWEARTGCQAPAECPGKRGRPAGGKNKRVQSNVSADEDGSARKKQRGMAMQTQLATYVPSTAIRATILRTQPSERLKVTVAASDFDERELSLEASYLIEDGAKIDIDLNDGKPPHPYVAKRFFNIGNGINKVSCEENGHYLRLEAERLERGQFYLGKFLEVAKEAGVSVSSGFAFADFILARENTEPEEPGSVAPSKASGIPAEKWETDWPASDPPVGIMWLLERRRTSAVDRWSEGL
ncbi:hypothetical protein K466DRAFT_595713 [Polyporus arcularius HHB13444]|uniref:Uncharacterized protein n=1 Tax=Polyporus arcularius HHB13444 TaxID=1314778 RepID=A0A5C3PQM8_9APHY|nr:hypothetical protein K466DRAFT_595713 [Polyporus arcularius HHB13444]